MKQIKMIPILAMAFAMLMVSCKDKDNNDPTPTEDAAPTVVSTMPENSDTDVARNHKVVVTFSEEMDPSTINSTTFTVEQGTTDISGDVVYSGVEATFTPSVVFDAASEYTATISTTAKSQKGVNLVENYEWNFTTSGSTAGID
ncbi:Ig-like domain-containing protein, partial [Marivirga sp.]|uniref:Ig-like domain-containing protein n=1 Tax=Marivirga sp. TaxID=2018662 RepID=UPI0025D9456E